jgi:hypothetical protein
MTTMSIRGLDEHLLAQLKQQAVQEGSSLNSLVLRILQGGGKSAPAPVLTKFDDLDAFAGGWNSDDAATFARATAPFAEFDATLWR